MYICYVLTYRRLISVSISFRNFFFKEIKKENSIKSSNFMWYFSISGPIRNFSLHSCFWYSTNKELIIYDVWKGRITVFPQKKMKSTEKKMKGHSFIWKCFDVNLTQRNANII